MADVDLVASDVLSLAFPEASATGIEEFVVPTPTDLHLVGREAQVISFGWESGDEFFDIRRNGALIALNIKYNAVLGKIYEDRQGLVETGFYEYQVRAARPLVAQKDVGDDLAVETVEALGALDIETIATIN